MTRASAPIYRGDITHRYIELIGGVLLELAILGLLKERAMHGYQLKKSLADTLGGFWQVSYGSLYPALKRLQQAGAVEMLLPKTEVGRRKNVYRITPDGEALFARLLGEVGRDAMGDDGFPVRFAFFRYLNPETRIGLLERRRALLEGRLATLRASLQNYRERIDAYTLSLMNHGLASTESDIQWLDDLIRAERRQVRQRRGRRRSSSVMPQQDLMPQKERAR